MKAEDKSFYFLAPPSYYDIPFFQRAYVWNEENWDELLSNLTSKNQNHFLGSLILKNELVSSGSISRFSVIDGQQRLTTLSILLRACFDHIVKHAKEYGYDEDVIKNCKYSMEILLFVAEGGIKRNLEVKIKHSNIDRKSFESIIHGKFDENDKWENYLTKYNQDSVSSIIKAYIYFRKELNQLTQDTIEYVWELLTVDKIKFLVNIDLDSNDNEQAIFDSVNSAGVRLSSADTIKNLLYQKYVELLRAFDSNNVDEKAIALYEETWEDAFLADEDTNAYWDEQRQSGRMKRSIIETFLHAFAVVGGFFHPSENNISDLAQTYRKKIANMSLEEIGQFLIEIHDYAEVFKEYFTFENTFLYLDDYINRTLNICNVLDVSTFYPYFLKQLYAYKKGTISEKELQHSFFSIEKYILLNAICKGNTKHYNLECLQIVNGRKSPEEVMHSCADITEENFVNGFRYMAQNKLPTLLLFWIELFQRNRFNVDVKQLKYEYTLEHIMPKKWKKNWSNVPVYDSSGNQIFDENEIQRIRDRAICEIGNMTLLNAKLNTAVSNGAFFDKVHGNAGKKGLKDLADLRLTKDVIAYGSWDERNIYNRSRELEQMVRVIWDIKDLPREMGLKIPT